MNLLTHRDSIKWSPRVEIIKYTPDQVRELTDFLGHEPSGPELRELERLGRAIPDDILVVEGNSLVTVGLNRIVKLIAGEAVDPFNAAKGIIGIGNGTAATTAGMTDLQGASKYYENLDSAPTATNGSLSAAATFGGTVGNFSWEEWVFGIAANASVTPAATLAGAGGASSVILNRKVAALGGKVSGASWTLQSTVTLS